MSENNPNSFIREDESVQVDFEESTDTKRHAKGKRLNKKHITLFVIVGCLVTMFGLAVSSFFGGDSADTSEPFSSGARNVQIIDISGEIEESGETYNQDWIDARIEEAKNDSDNVAIALILDTPGGAVYECDETYTNLMNYKKETGRPVYAYCESLNASAGYYIATAADKIYANRNSLVGCIGVISSQFVDATGFLEKLGIDITTIHSGKNKIMGAVYESPTEEQLAIMQAISDEAYDQFVGVVAKGRDMDRDAVLALADGRLYTAKQAVENGLIDDIMTLEEFDELLKDELGDVTYYHKTYTKDKWERLLDSVGAVTNAITNRSELASGLNKLDELTITEPMYLYQE